MSFATALGKDLEIVGKDALAIAPIAAAVVGTFNPPMGLLITGVTGRIQAAMTAAEQTVTQPKQGATKSAMVLADFQSGFAMAEDITGKTYTYDATKLQAYIDAQTAALNAAAEFKATIKQS